MEPTVTIPLSTTVRAIGSHGELQITPSPLDLGGALIDAAVSVSVTFTNKGTHPVTIDSLMLTREQPAGQFGCSGPPAPIAPGRSDTVTVSFMPTQMARATATLTVQMHSATDGGPVFSTAYDVPLTAVGQRPMIFFAGSALPPMPPRRPVRSRELQVLDFAIGKPDTDLAATFWIRNVGNVPLEIGIFSELLPFSVPDVATRFPAVIAPGSELEVPSRYHTSAVPGQTTRASLRFLSNDTARGTAMLGGTAKAGGPHLSAPAAFERGVVLVRQPPAVATVIFESDGTVPVTVTQLLPRPGGNFQITATPPLPAQLAPGTELTLTISTSAQNPGVEDNLALLDERGAQIPGTAIKLRSV